MKTILFLPNEIKKIRRGKKDLSNSATSCGIEKMIKLGAIKKKRRDEEEEEEKEGNPPKKRFQSSAYLRLTKDIHDLSPPENSEVDFPDPDDIYHFKYTVTPDEGFYKEIKVVFEFEFPETYPYEPPKVKCLTEIYHPNIDVEGNVCLNILRQDWRPVLSINSILYGLHFLLTEPNADDPLNEVAANELRYDPEGFAENVKNVSLGLTSASDISSEES